MILINLVQCADAHTNNQREYRKQYRKQYRSTNADKLREYQKQYRSTNADKLREYQKHYCEVNAEKIREKKQRCAAERAEKRRQYTAANAEKIRERRLRYNAANAEKIRERKQQYNAANAAKVHAQYLQKRAQDPKGTWLKDAYRCALSRAKKRGLPYDKDLPDLELPDVCPVLGIALVYFNGNGRLQPNSPSLDRINPLLGYVASNLRVISFRANKLKNDASVDEIRAVLRYMESES